MRQEGGSAGWQRKIKALIDRAFRFGIEYGLIKGMHQSPAYGINLGRKPETKPEILTIAEIKKLLSQAKTLHHPWYPVWVLALMTGMRNGELNALLWSDVDWENKQITVSKSYDTRRRRVKSTKSGYWRTVPISDELLKFLKELKLSSKDRKHVLPRLENWNRGGQAKVLRTFCAGIGLPKIKFHTLRACFATQLIRNGIAPIQIQKICGWRDLDTMQRYIRLAGIETDGATDCLKIIPDEDVMAKVINLFSEE